METNNNIETLAKRVSEGIATEQEIGVVLKQLQISLATSMLQELQEYNKSLDALKEIRMRLIDRLETIIITDIDLMDVDTVTNLLKETSNMQMDNLDFQRKLIQGKSIFDFNTLSDEEKQVVQLMNSFASLEEKQKFLQLVQEQLGVE